jgi:hypothetical protein
MYCGGAQSVHAVPRKQRKYGWEEYSGKLLG